MKSQFLPSFFIIGFLTERFFYTYSFSYFAALLALGALAVRPSYRDVLAITALFTIALISDLGLIRIEVRYLAFFILFLTAARRLSFNPWLFFLMQAFFLLLSFFSSEVATERFIFGTSASALILLLYLQNQEKGIWQKIFVNVLSLTSLLIPFLGYGSRSALVLWLVVNWRVTALFLPVAIISVPIFLNEMNINLPVIEKAVSTMSELFEEQSVYGAFSLRAFENIFFLEWFTTASPWELALGSGYEATMPGDIVGDQYSEFSYIPHAFAFGVVFQLGVLGLIVLAWWMYVFFRYREYQLNVVLLASTLLVLGFIVKHGFFDTDLVMAFAALNYISASSDREAPFRARSRIRA
jgi:hypothetical protein